MAVREFTDASGREWRAWDIKPDEIRPVTRGEDYLADCYLAGWVVFETKAGDEKRRLCPWPIKWMDETERGLRRLLSMAEVVPPQRVRAERESGAPSILAREMNLGIPAEDADVTDLEVVRTFRYPGGHLWTLSVIPYPEYGGPPVLRFTAGLRSIDLSEWPKDWPDQPDNVLIAMLRRASPRDESRPSGGTEGGGGESWSGPRRRWDDQPAAHA